MAADEHRKQVASAPYLITPEGPWGRFMGNHPVGVPYPLRGTKSEYRLYGPRSLPLSGWQWQPDPRTFGLKIFTDESGFEPREGRAGIECASCHDPHGTANSYFLRLPKARSELCLGCHRK